MRQCPACSRQFGAGTELCPYDGRRLVAAEIASGTVIDDRYRIEELLGRGGLGAVYRATHLRLGRPVAIKVVRGEHASDPAVADRFEREATTLARLKHPNVVGIYDFGVAPGIGAYLAMELLEGRSLGDEIRKRGHLTAAQTAELMESVCAAVQAAHDLGIIHRDLKPENIFLETASDGQTVKVLDFGIAKLAQGDAAGDAIRLTAAGALIGTPAYMSPEQCAGSDIDARSDIYSLGCVAYEMLTGRPPFMGNLQAVMYQHTVEPPEPPSHLASNIAPPADAAVLRALAKRPEERFQTAVEFGRALWESIALPTVVFRQSDLPSAPPNYTYPMTRDSGSRRAMTGRGNLPEDLAGFVGRERDIVQVKALLQASRLLTLVGTGGIGKTRLALHVASEVVDNYPDGVWLVDFASLGDPALVPHAVATALGVREEPGRPLPDSIAEYLAPRKLLLVLDNCEHLVDAAAALAETLLGSIRGLAILTTSREALNIAGEVVWQVPPLSLPQDGEETLDELMRYEAVRLFCERAVAADPRFELTERNAHDVVRLCAQLDGLPLAIELAAARTRVLTVEQIVARLGDRFGLLAGGRRTAQLRQQTLRATIDWSYDLLSEDERVLFARLSVFVGGWTLDAAEDITGKEEGGRHFVTEEELKTVSRNSSSTSDLQPSAFSLQPSDVLDVLTRLVDKSLVIVDRRAGGARYRMLETIRRYAAEKLQESGETARIHALHRDWFLQLAEKGMPELSGSRGREWMRRLEAEHDNLRAALHWSIREGGDPDASLRFAYALGQFWAVRGHPSEGSVWAGEALAASSDESPLARANELYWLGSIAIAEGHLDRASALLESGLALKDSLGRDQGSALGSQALGRIAERLGDYERAEALHEQSLAIYKELGDQAGIARALFGLGSSAVKQGDFDRAVVLFEVCLAVLRKVDDGRGTALVRFSLGEALRKQGDGTRALDDLRGARAAASELGLGGLEALALRRQALVAAERDELDVATALYREALVLCRNGGDMLGVAAAMEGLACVAAARDDRTLMLKLAGAANGIRGSDTIATPSEERMALDRVLAAARTDLGSAAANITVASGRALSPEAAVELALGGRATA